MDPQSARTRGLKNEAHVCSRVRRVRRIVTKRGVYSAADGGGVLEKCVSIEE